MAMYGTGVYFGYFFRSFFLASENVEKLMALLEIYGACDIFVSVCVTFWKDVNVN